MSHTKYRNIRFKPESLARIEQCNEIVERYQAQGLRLTLRQLYYQLVTINAVTNEEKSYKNLSTVVSDARLAGLMDWAAIEDRGRPPITPSEWNDLSRLVEAACHSYRLPRWKGQESYAELWVEKQALAGVLEPLAREFHVTLMVNKGYASQSSMYESAQRFLEACGAANDECETCSNTGDCAACEGSGELENDRHKTVRCWECKGKKVCADCEGSGYNLHVEPSYDRQPILFYLGDHDPSGEDMVRDVRARMEMFGLRGIRVEKLALTTAQVKQYKPPPNPAKLTDPRAAAYVREYGQKSWEVDALPPNVLATLIRDAFEEVLDLEKMDAVKLEEETDKAELRRATDKILKKKR